MKRRIFTIVICLSTHFTYCQVQKWEDWQSNFNLYGGSTLTTSPTLRNLGLNLWVDRGFGTELHFRNSTWGTALFTRNSHEAIWLGNYGVGETQQQNFTPWMTLVNGNVGIGTPNPSTKLQVIGNGTFVPSINGSPFTIDISNLPTDNAWSGVTLKAGSSQGTGSLETNFDNWGGNYLWSRNSPTGYHYGAKLSTGSGSATTYDLYHSDTDVPNIHISTGGSTYFNGGNIGIGTTTPSALLQVGNGSENTGVYINGSSSDAIQAGANLNLGNVTLQQNSTGGLTAWTYNNGWQGRLFINGVNGNIGIGISTNPTEKLSVDGNIKTKKIIVTQTGWADYVFHSSYNLRSLSSLETYIKKYEHLPNVPSADEVAKNGLDMGATQAALLRKIEELTLYVIEQDKRIKKLEQRESAKYPSIKPSYKTK